MLYFFRKIFSLLMTAVVILFTGSNGAQPHDVKDPESIRLSFALVADVHVEGNNTGRLTAFEKILADINNTVTPNDAVVFLGDNTMNGQFIESDLFYGSVRNILGKSNVLVAPGNHDFSNGEEAYAPYAEKFVAYNNTFFGAQLTKPYYYKVIDGCYFIVLSSEDSTVNDMYISAEQFDWFEDTMQLAGESGNPIFVCAHHYFTWLSDNTDGSLEEIMNDYDNVFYFYGHTHMQLCDYSIRDVGNIHTVNLPRVTEMSNGDKEPCDTTGIGAQIEVYDDRVVVRPRSYYFGSWIEEYEKTWSLV